MKSVLSRAGQQSAVVQSGELGSARVRPTLSVAPSKQDTMSSAGGDVRVGGNPSAIPGLAMDSEKYKRRARRVSGWGFAAMVMSLGKGEERARIVGVARLRKYMARVYRYALWTSRVRRANWTVRGWTSSGRSRGLTTVSTVCFALTVSPQPRFNCAALTLHAHC